MKLKAKISITGLTSEQVKVICGSLEPEVRSEKELGRGVVSIKCMDNSVTLIIESNRLSDLQALVNSYSNLFKITLDMVEANL